MRPLLALVALAALLATGCGGQNATTYSAEGTRNCLNGVVDVDPDPANVDAIALAASGGAVRATVHWKEVIVSFGSDTAEARQVEQSYEAVETAFGGSTERETNAVIAWSESPTKDERTLVRGCLRE